MNPRALRAFPSPASFRAWLQKNHASEAELLLRCFKTHAADQGITYAQALDEALCFGWIDGVRRRVDDVSFSVRFTPRRQKSVWSRVNVAHVRRLIRAGRMAPSGRAAFAARAERRTGVYSFERRPRALAPAYMMTFRSQRLAWSYYQEQAPWYRRTSAFWVMSAKREETRARRLAALIACCARRAPLPLLARAPQPVPSAAGSVRPIKEKKR